MREIVREQLGFVRHPLSDGSGDSRDVEEIAVGQVVTKAIATPRAAPHRERKREAIVEAATGRDAMRLIDDNACNRQREA